MKVLVITGDKSFGPGHPRYDLQRAQVEELAVVYWGKGSIWPKIPTGKLSAQGGPASGWDVVTVQDPFWRGLFGYWVARRKKAKFNVQVHVDLREASEVRKKSVGLGLTVRSADFVGLRERIARFVLHRADSIRVVSEKIKEQVLKLGIHAQIFVLPVFIEVNTFAGIFRREHKAKNILWIGRFEDEKDPFLAIDVLKEVLQQRSDVFLIMIGDGSWRQELSDYAANLPVVLPGWQNTAFHLETADVVLCTSRHESYGASIVEALAAGVPVVAPDVGVAKEAGAVVVPRAEFARAVAEVLNSGRRGELRLPMLSKEEWGRRWCESL